MQGRRVGKDRRKEGGKERKGRSGYGRREGGKGRKEKDGRKEGEGRRDRQGGM